MDVSLFDITKLIQHYEKKNAHQHLRLLHRDAFNACAAESDLNFATRILASINEAHANAEAIPQEFYNLGRGACLFTCIAMYARATKLRDKARGAVDLAAKLSGDNLADHNALQSLRDDAIAHLGAGKGAVKEPWWKGTLILRYIWGQSHDFGFMDNHAMYDIHAKAKLDRLLPIAIPLVREMAKERQERLMEELFRIKRINERFSDRLEETLFNPREFFADSPDYDVVYTNPSDAHRYLPDNERK